MQAVLIGRREAAEVKTGGLMLSSVRPRQPRRHTEGTDLTTYLPAAERYVLRGRTYTWTRGLGSKHGCLDMESWQERAFLTIPNPVHVKNRGSSYLPYP